MRSHECLKFQIQCDHYALKEGRTTWYINVLRKKKLVVSRAILVSKYIDGWLINDFPEWLFHRPSFTRLEWKIFHWQHTCTFINGNQFETDSFTEASWCQIRTTEKVGRRTSYEWNRMILGMNLPCSVLKIHYRLLRCVRFNLKVIVVIWVINLLYINNHGLFNHVTCYDYHCLSP